MSERSEKFAHELEALIKDGDLLLQAIQHDCLSDQFKQVWMKEFNGDKQRLESFIKTLPNFKKEYQSWYSKSMSVIQQVLPSRISDFKSHYDVPKGRREITFQNYMIRDYLQGLAIKKTWGQEVVVDGSAAIPEFIQQLNMVKAAKDALNSTLMDLRAVLQADLFDTEVETAKVLATGGYFRASGAICGVVIEKHLLSVCDNHSLTVRKKNPGISDLNQMLRDANITTVPQWRFIQLLADIRNICDHAKGREPTKDEIDDLVAGAEKVIKTVF